MVKREMVYYRILKIVFRRCFPELNRAIIDVTLSKGSNRVSKNDVDPSSSVGCITPTEHHNFSYDVHQVRYICLSLGDWEIRTSISTSGVEFLI